MMEERVALEQAATDVFDYAQDTWIMVEINFDLDADFAEVYFDGALMTVFRMGRNHWWYRLLRIRPGW